MRRRVIKVCAILLVGAIVNVAVAWGLAYWVRFDWRSTTPGQTIDHYVGLFDEADRSPFANYPANRYRRLGSERVDVCYLDVTSGPGGKSTIAFVDILPKWSL